MYNPDNYLKIQQDFKECGKFFAAIGNETRQSIIYNLIMAKEEGMRVGRITELTHLSRPAVSHHLKILKDAGIAHVRQEGTKNYYYICIKEHIPMLERAHKDLEEFVNTVYDNQNEKE